MGFAIVAIGYGEFTADDFFRSHQFTSTMGRYPAMQAVVVESDKPCP